MVGLVSEFVCGFDGTPKDYAVGWLEHRRSMIRLWRICLWTSVWVLIGGLFTATVEAQRGRQLAARIVWHGTWKGGLAEAQRTGKPIMLVSAAPQCQAVPGVW